MKRVVCLSALSVILGVYISTFADLSVCVFISLILILTTTIKLIASKSGKNIIFLLLAIIFTLSQGYSIYRGDITLKALHPYSDEYINAVCEVSERPQTKDGETTFICRVKEVEFLGEITYPDEMLRLSAGQENEKVDFGDVFTARIRIYPPRDASNEGDFDYKMYLKTKRIFFTGYVDGNTLKVTGENRKGISYRIKKLHYNYCDLIDAAFTEDTGTVLKGILLGNKGEMDEGLKQQFSRSGLSHITAVSGMHVATLVMIIYALFKVIRVRKRLAGLFAIVAIIMFVCISGASLSCVRAGIMSIMVIGAEFTYRKNDTYTSMATAVMIIVIAWPFAAFDAGFILSFGAVFGIVLFSRKIEEFILNLVHVKRTQDDGFLKLLVIKIISMLSTTFGAQLIIVPVILYFFNEITLWGFVTNLIILPVLPFIMAGGILFCILGSVSHTLALLAGGFCYPFLLLVLAVVKFFGSLNFGYITFGYVTPFFVFIYLLALALIYLLLDKRRRIMSVIPGVSLILLCVILMLYALNTQMARVMFINVGQGDCSCISLPKGIDILIDAGGTAPHQTYYDVGLKKVRPYLLKNGVNKIEYMIASHGHEDHIMGLVTILDETEVEKLIVPAGFGTTEVAKKLLEKAESACVDVLKVSAGDKIFITEDAYIEIFMPTDELADELTEDEENNRSLVMRFNYGENSVLYTGDLESDYEKHLLEHTDGNLQADIIKVAHHGSDNSTSGELLERVKPEYAFVPVGKNNYGHPGKEVLARLAKMRVKVYRADEDKDVIFKMKPTGIVSISD